MKFTRTERIKYSIAAIIVIVTISVSSILGAVFIYVGTSGGEGSIEEAQRMKSLLVAATDPEIEIGPGEEYSFHRFDNDEWLCGLSRSSHGFMSKYRGGGTVVVKDSRGQIRCFFGHVCGSHYPKNCAVFSKDLNYYYEWTSDNLKEISLP